MNKQSGKNEAADDFTRLDSLQSVHFDLAYQLGSETAESLYRKSVVEQWDMESQVDWDQTIDPSTVLLPVNREVLENLPLFSDLSPSERESFFANYAIEWLSQLLHGEQGSLLIASRLVQSLPGRSGKLLAAAQCMDEARHVDVFARYIKRQNAVSAPTPTIKRVLTKIQGADNWVFQLVGMQIIVEGLAMATFRELNRNISCPVMSQLLPAVLRDESRHVAFGTITLREAVAGLDEATLESLEDFVWDLVQDYRWWGQKPEDWMGIMSSLILAGVDPSDFLRAMRARLTTGKIMRLPHSIARAMETLIIPSLERLKLIPDRLRARYVESGLPLVTEETLLQEIERQANASL